MNQEGPDAALIRALALSREILAAAEQADLPSVKALDVERMQLIKSARRTGDATRASDRAVLTEIAALNDRALGLVEHHRRRKGREMDMAAVGRRAVAAYSTIRLQR